MSNLLSQASLVMIPSGYKEDIVYSPVPTNGNGDLSFTRASNGTRINSSGLVEVCPWNLLEQSNAFTTSPWSFVGTPTLTANYATNPLSGANDAWRFQSASGGERIVNSVAGAFSTLSVYAKGTGTIQIRDSSGTYYIDVALTSSWQRISVYIPATFTNVQILSNGGCDATIYGAQLNIGSTAKPYFPTTDRLNVPRLTYQNGGGGCPSLLLEKQSSNTLSYSQDFTDAVWLKGAGLSVTGNTTTSPDGTQNAGTITNTATSNCFLYQLASTSATTWTMSLYAKKGTNKYLGVTLCSATYQATSRYQPVFNLDNGTLQTINQSGSNETNTSYSITAVGDGWYRLTATATFAAGSDQCYIVLQSSNNTSYTPASGNLDWTTPTTGNYYLWGAQGEVSFYPTSYIPTTSSSATRVADACYKTGISSLIGQTEGVLFVDFYAKGSYDSNNLLMLISGGSGGDIVYLNLVGGTIEAYIAASSTQQFLYNGTTALVANTRHKLAIAYASNDIVLYHNGVQLATDTSATIPACSLVRIGDFLGGLYQFGNTINQAILFPTRLTNAELASLTTL